MTHSIPTLSTLSVIKLRVAFSYCYVECSYAECHNMPNVFMLSVIMPNVFMLSVIMLNILMLSVIMPNVFMLSVIMTDVIMLNVAAPCCRILKLNFITTM
jgi:hypothetical protein